MTDAQWSEPFTGPEMKALGEYIRGVQTLWNEGDVGTSWSFLCTDAAYRLPADHPAVKVALRNRAENDDMVYWPGGDEAPGDWDGGDVLYRDGDIASYYANNRWHWEATDYLQKNDIIGYHKRTEQPAEVVGEGNHPEWAMDRVNEYDDGSHTGLRRAFARYIAAHEDPPVDPVKEALAEAYGSAAPEFVAAFKAAIAKRGLQITEAQ